MGRTPTGGRGRGRGRGGCGRVQMRKAYSVNSQSVMCCWEAFDLVALVREEGAGEAVAEEPGERLVGLQGVEGRAERAGEAGVRVLLVAVALQRRGWFRLVADAEEEGGHGARDAEVGIGGGIAKSPAQGGSPDPLSGGIRSIALRLSRPQSISQGARVSGPKRLYELTVGLSPGHITQTVISI